MRKVADCRRFPSEQNCQLAIAGEEQEVMKAAVAHAVADHGHEDGPELRKMIRELLVDEPPGWVLPTQRGESEEARPLM